MTKILQVTVRVAFIAFFSLSQIYWGYQATALADVEKYKNLTLVRKGIELSIGIQNTQSATRVKQQNSRPYAAKVAFDQAATIARAQFLPRLVGERVSLLLFGSHATLGLRMSEPPIGTVVHVTFRDKARRDHFVDEFSSAKSDPSRQDEVFISFIQDVMSVSPEDDELVLTVRPGQAPVLTLPIPEAVADNIAHGALAPDDWLLVADEWIVTFTRIERIGDAMHITLSGDNPTRPWPVDAGMDGK